MVAERLISACED